MTTSANEGADVTKHQNADERLNADRSASAAERMRAIARPVGRALVRFRALPWILATALVAGSAGVAVLGYRLHQENLQQQRDQGILAAARQEALNFISLDYRRFDQDSRNVLAGATGDFKQQFSDESATLKSVVTANKAVSSGQVLQAG